LNRLVPLRANYPAADRALRELANRYVPDRWFAAMFCNLSLEITAFNTIRPSACSLHKLSDDATSDEQAQVNQPDQPVRRPARWLRLVLCEH
jgi:hypothetical protein